MFFLTCFICSETSGTKNSKTSCPRREVVIIIILIPLESNCCSDFLKLENFKLPIEFYKKYCEFFMTRQVWCLFIYNMILIRSYIIKS